MNGATRIVLCTCSLALSGCATMLHGTTQRVQVITEPPGARCAMTNTASHEPIVIAATPADAEVPRSRSPLNLKCTLADHLEFEDAIARDEEGQTGSKAANVQLAYGSMLVGSQAGIALAVPAAIAGSAGAVVVVAASVLLLPMYVISGVTDVVSGAAYGYPPVVQIVLVPMVFPSEDARKAFFDALDRRVDSYAAELERLTALWCRSNCAYLRGEDSALVQRQRERVVAMRSQTRVADP